MENGYELNTEQRRAVLDWQHGYDTGLSSQALVSFLSDGTIVDGRRDRNHPLDPADLGRCLRALRTLPFLRERLAKAGVLSPVWATYIEHWNRLTELHDEEEPNGRAPKCYAAMRVIQDVVEGGGAITSAAIETAIAEAAATHAAEPKKQKKPSAFFVVSEDERRMLEGKSLDFGATYLKALGKEHGGPCARCKRKREVMLFGRYGPTPTRELCDECARATAVAS